MQRLKVSTLNPVNKWSENPERFLLEHCGNLVKVGGGDLEIKIVSFVERLVRCGHEIPPLERSKFPREFQSERFVKMCKYSIRKKVA